MLSNEQHLGKKLETRVLRIGSSNYRVIEPTWLTKPDPCRDTRHVELKAESFGESDENCSDLKVYSNEDDKFGKFLVYKEINVVFGKAGKTKAKIEKFSGCKLYINFKDNEVKLFGTCPQIYDGYLRVQNILNLPKEPNYFLAFPMQSEFSQTQLVELQEEIKELNKRTQINFKFNEPNRAHITIIMLNLKTQEQLELAKKLFSSLKPELQALVNNQQFYKIDWHSELKCFGKGKDSVKNARTLVAKPSDNSLKKLDCLVDIITSKFEQAGLTRNFEEKNLHLTLAQTVQNCDYSEIVKKLKCKFSSWTLDRIEFSKRFSYSKESGYYQCVDKITLHP